MNRRYQIDQQRAVQQFRQLAREENPSIQMIFPMAEVVGLLQEGVGHLLREAGLALMNLVMQEEVRHLAGERHQQHPERRADQGSAAAEWMIGGLYFHGWGVIRDFTEAATWFRRAAEAGVPVAQWDLGMMYYQGYGVSKDLATARAWLQKAAARGYAPAKDMLAKQT